jgi:hypothetical protein
VSTLFDLSSHLSLLCTQTPLFLFSATFEHWQSLNTVTV